MIDSKNVGRGELDWDVLFGTLHEVGLDGIMTACAFAGEERAEESSRFMRQEMQLRRQISGHRQPGHRTGPLSPARRSGLPWPMRFLERRLVPWKGRA
jgi:hypothetical protein